MWEHMAEEADVKDREKNLKIIINIWRAYLGAIDVL